MSIIGGILRLTGAALFAGAVAQAIRPRPLDVALLLAFAVLALVVAETLSPRAPSG